LEEDGSVYAVIQSGGRQVRVEPGAVVTVDHIALPAGEQITSRQVLFVAGDDGSFIAGTPLVAGARVTGIVDGPERGPKIRVFRKKRRKGRRRTLGHRTALTRVRITGIETDASHGT
jgi:large subunit ribosomal protein L21